MGHLREQRDERGVALGLVVTQEDDVLAAIERGFRVGEALRVEQDRSVELDELPDVRVGHLIVIEV